MSEISARCFLFVGNISATICKNLIFKIFYLVRKVFLICAKSDSDTAEDALEILKKYNPKNKELTVDDATVTIVEIIFSDKNSMSVSMTEQTLDSLEKAFFALAEKYCKDV